MSIDINALFNGTQSYYSPEVWELTTWAIDKVPGEPNANLMHLAIRLIHIKREIHEYLTDMYPTTGEKLLLEQRLGEIDTALAANTHKMLAFGKSILLQQWEGFNLIPDRSQNYLALIFTSLVEFIGSREALGQLKNNVSTFEFIHRFRDLPLLDVVFVQICEQTGKSIALEEVPKNYTLTALKEQILWLDGWQDNLICPESYTRLPVGENLQVALENFDKIKGHIDLVQYLSDPANLESGVTLKLDGITIQIGKASGSTFDRNRDEVLSSTPFLYKLLGYTIEGVDLYHPSDYQDNIQISVYDNHSQIPLLSMALAEDTTNATLGQAIYMDSKLPTLDLLELEMNTLVQLNEHIRIPLSGLPCSFTVEATRLASSLELSKVNPERLRDLILDGQIHSWEKGMLANYLMIHKIILGDKFETDKYYETLDAALTMDLIDTTAVKLIKGEVEAIDRKAIQKRELVERSKVAKTAFAFVLSAYMLAQQKILIGNFAPGAADLFAKSISGTTMQIIPGTPREGSPDVETFEPYFELHSSPGNQVQGFLLSKNFYTGMMHVWTKGFTGRNDISPREIVPLLSLGTHITSTSLSVPVHEEVHVPIEA